MGDRTYVCLSVPTALKDKALAVMDASGWEPNYDEHSDEVATCWAFEDVNYGELPFLDDVDFIDFVTLFVKIFKSVSVVFFGDIFEYF